MPVISITMGQASREQKEELIAGLTEKAMEITGSPAKAFFVTINELNDCNIGLGGKSVAEIKAGQK